MGYTGYEITIGNFVANWINPSFGRLMTKGAAGCLVDIFVEMWYNGVVKKME